MKKKYFIISVMMVVVMLLTACAQKTATPVVEEPTEKALPIGVSLDALFLGRQAEMEGVRAAPKENDVTLLESVADNDPTQQQAQIEAFINGPREAQPHRYSG